jgi:hypothetical protein
VSRSEVEVLELLENQTRLQEESMNNAREFSNVFKNITNSMTKIPQDFIRLAFICQLMHIFRATYLGIYYTLVDMKFF